MDYAFRHEGRVFLPSGKVMTATEAETKAYNAALNERELEAWKLRPLHWVAYIKDETNELVTWLGAKLGTVTMGRIYRGGFGGRLRAVTIHGNNGAIYYGRYSIDTGNVVRLRRAVTSKANNDLSAVFAPNPAPFVRRRKKETSRP